MKKDDFIHAASEAVPGLKKHQANEIYKVFMLKMHKSLLEGHSIRFVGIGTLSVTVRKATTYRNPQNRQLIKKEAHCRIKFTMSKNMKADLNKDKKAE